MKELISQLDFTEETLRDALVSQARLLFSASRYRVRKLRDRLRIEADLSQVQTTVALRLRNTYKEKKITEAFIKERVASSDDVVEVRVKLDEAKVLEEQAKLLVDAYQSRGSMVKALVQLIGSEAAVEKHFVQSALEQMGLQKLKSRVRNKYPGKVVDGDDD